VRAEGKLGKTVYQLRVAETKPQYPSLRTVKARTGNGDAMVKIVYKMFYQAGARPADVGL
jgi:hypothetical protein